MVLTVNVVGALSAEPLYAVPADLDWDVSDLKWEIERQHGVPDIEQRFLVQGRILGNWDLIRDIAPSGSNEVEVSLMRLDPVFAAMLRDIRAGLVRLGDVSASYQADRDIVLAAVGRGEEVLQHAASELRSDREVVLAAVQKHGQSLKHASENLRRDDNVVKAAVESQGLAIKYAFLADGAVDREIACIAVRQNGWAFELLPAFLQADRNILVIALQQEGLVLQFAPQCLRCDREMVLLAVRSNAEALRLVSRELKEDQEVIRAATYGVRLRGTGGSSFFQNLLASH